ncbi:hypothetical protein MP228_011929 [Amoeboaphelidium protococcarum]|nr:hypothetical protein MP228_011929 [Amoeboaphelidium protococcarum]
MHNPDIDWSAVTPDQVSDLQSSSVSDLSVSADHKSVSVSDHVSVSTVADHKSVSVSDHVSVSTVADNKSVSVSEHVSVSTVVDSVSDSNSASVSTLPVTLTESTTINASTSVSDSISTPPLVCINATVLDMYQKDEENTIIPGFVYEDEDGIINYHCLSDIIQEQICLMQKDTEISDPVLPDQIQEFGDVFMKQQLNELPPHREQDCTIDLEPGAKPPVGKLYKLTQEEDAVMRDWLQKNVDRGFIRKSQSPYGAPCFFVRKAEWTQDSKLRLCMDYRGLNKITIKNRNPLPNISDLFRSLQKGKLFTALDLDGAFELLRVKAGHEAKTAFLTKYGQYEFLVMPFGLANAPAQFQTFMNDLFKNQIGKFVVVYLDDIVVYTDGDEEEHWQHVREVLQILRCNKLYCKLSKCKFAQSSTSFLGYILSKDGILMDPRKVEAVTQWPTPKNVKDVMMFHGFVNFYRKFIPHFADLTRPLTQLLKKDVAFTWDAEKQHAFDSLKKMFNSNIVLSHPDEEKPFVVEADASDYGIAGVLSQQSDSGEFKPVAFYSRQLNPAERNYEIYDKELLAIHQCFKEWRHFLQGGKHQVTVLTDHKSLQYFMTTKQLTRRQARWSLFFSEFDFVLTHRPGARNGKADLLSRRSDYAVDEEKYNFRCLLDPSKFVTPQELDLFSISFDQDLQCQLIRSDVLNKEFDEEHDWPLVIAHFLLTDEWLDVSSDILDKCKQECQHFIMVHGKLHRILADNRSKRPYLLKSDRDAHIARFHDGLGHFKYDSIVDLIERRFWWPDMHADIKQYIKECAQCQLDASKNQFTQQTPLRPIPPVALPFERWGIDFVQDLQTTKSGNNHIITAIDYATRWVVAKAVKFRDSDTVADFLYNDIFMNYGAPYEILSDRAKSFLADGIAKYERMQGVRPIATAPYHPQTNGMVERMHSMLNHAITTLTNGRPERWDEYLKQALFGIRCRTHAVTKKSPFYMLYGVEPRLLGDSRPPECTLQPLDEIEQLEEKGEIMARTFEAMGDSRAAAYERSKTQAESMRRRHNLDPNAPEYYFKIGDWVKLKHHSMNKFEFDWKGPYHVVDVGFPGTYWLMSPDGTRFDATVNERDLAPFLAATEKNKDYFYDGSSRSSVNQLPFREGGSVSTRVDQVSTEDSMGLR